MPASFDPDSRRIVAWPLNAVRTEMEWRPAGGAWASAGTQPAGASVEIAVPPLAATYELRMRAAGEDAWYAVEAVAVPAQEPALIIEDLPADGWPSADRGTKGTVWIAGRRAWRHAGDPFSEPVPSDVGPEGVAGVIWRADGLTKTRRPNGYTDIQSDRRLTDATRLSDRVTVKSDTWFSEFEYRPASEVVLRLSPGKADLIDEIEQDLGVAVRSNLGAAAWATRGEGESGDPDEPYALQDAPAAKWNAVVDPAAALSFDAFIYRVSLRRPGDPLSPWVAAPGFVVTGYRAVTVYLRAGAAAAPAAPTIGWASTPTDPFAVITPSGAWSLARPAAPAGDQAIWCSAATLDSADSDKSVVGHAPVICERPGQAPGDLDVVYIRSQTTPRPPAASADVPAGWHAAPPTDSTHQLWATVGRKAPGAAQFVWGKPFEIGKGDKGDKGDPGVSYGEHTVFKAVAAGGDPPAAPTVGYGWTAANGFSVSSVTGGWSSAHPGASRANDVYCAVATLVSTATRAVAQHVAKCGAATDVNVVFKRSVAKPGTPTSNARVPAGAAPNDLWFDTEEGTSGTAQLWESFGSIVDGAWSWKPPIKSGQGTPGDPGVSYEEHTVFKAVGAGGDPPAAPTVGYGWTAANGFSVSSVTGGWSSAHPGASRANDVYCAVATLVSTATRAVAQHVAKCGAATDVNVVFKRSVAKPGTPTSNARVPAGAAPNDLWFDTEEGTSGTAQLWESFGSIVDGAWSWKPPIKSGQGPPGNDGTTTVVVVQPPNVAALQLTGDKSAGTVTFTAHAGAASYTVNWMIHLPNGQYSTGSTRVTSAQTVRLPSIIGADLVVVLVTANNSAGQVLASATVQWTF